MKTYRIKEYKTLNPNMDYLDRKTLYTIEVTNKTIAGFVKSLLGEKDTEEVFDLEILNNHGFIFTDTGRKVMDYDFSLWQKLVAFEKKLDADEIIKNSLT